MFLLPDGTPRALSGAVDKTVRVWDPIAGKALHTLEGHTGTCGRRRVHAARRHAARPPRRGTRRCAWGPHRRQGAPHAEGHTDWVKCVAAFTLPDGTPRALSGSDDKTVRVWDPDDDATATDGAAAAERLAAVQREPQRIAVCL